MAFHNDRAFSDAAAVTPADATVVDFYGLYIGVTGDVVVKLEGGTSITLKSHPVGYTVPMHIIAVMTATTATNIIGFKA